VHVNDNKFAEPWFKMSAPYAKDLGNLLYHLAVVGGLSVGYNVVGKKLMKMKPADLGRLDAEDSMKLVGTVALAI